MILTILKVAGIVLLSLLGLILVLAFLALVLPVRYRLSCTAEEGKRPQALLKISYFLRIIRARAEYTDALYVSVKVFFFTIFQMQIPDKDQGEEEEYDLSELDEALDALDEEEEAQTLDSENATEIEVSGEGDTGEDAEISQEPENVDETESEERPGEDTESVPDEDEEPSDSLYDKIKFKVDEICDKIKRVRSEIRYYRNLYNSNEAKNAVFVIKKRLMRILKKLMPRRAHADVTFGFDSPDLTGKVYGLYTIFAKRFDRASRVIPDFDRKIFEGDLWCKGHFNIWCFIWNGLAIILNKNVRKIYKSYKHHSKRKENEESEGSKAA